MPLEQLGLLALFIVLALVNGIMRMRRTRTRTRNGLPKAHGAQPPTSREALPLSRREVGEGPVSREHDAKTITPLPSVLPPLHSARDRLISRPGLRQHQHGLGAALVPVTSRRSNNRESSTGARRWIGSIGSARQLRQAIALATILGPCRTLEPADVQGPGSG